MVQGPEGLVLLGLDLVRHVDGAQHDVQLDERRHGLHRLDDVAARWTLAVRYCAQSDELRNTKSSRWPLMMTTLGFQTSFLGCVGNTAPNIRSARRRV